MIKKIKLSKLAWVVLIALSLFLVLLPIYVMFKYSISDRASWITGGKYPVPWFPFNPTLDMYKYYLGDSRFWSNAFLSINVALLTVALSIIFGAPAAYSLARSKFSGKGIILFFILSIRLIPDISSAVPIATIFSNGLWDLLPVVLKLALAHTLLGLPYVIYIAIGVFESIPKDLEEQAHVMGCGKFFTFLSIVIPIAIPGLAAGAIYVFLLSWNEFTLSYFITSTSTVPMVPLPVFLKSMFGSFTPSPVGVATVSLIVSLPVIIFTFALQKYMISGSTAGSVK